MASKMASVGSRPSIPIKLAQQLARIVKHQKCAVCLEWLRAKFLNSCLWGHPMCLRCVIEFMVNAIKQGLAFKDMICPSCRCEFEPTWLSNDAWVVLKVTIKIAIENDEEREFDDGNQAKVVDLFKEYMVYVKNGPVLQQYTNLDMNRLGRVQFQQVLWDFSGLLWGGKYGRDINILDSDFALLMRLRLIRRRMRHSPQQWDRITTFMLDSAVRSF